VSASRSRVQRAHETETAVARWFAGRGWPYAEPVGAGRAGTDITGMPGLCVEVKARRDLDACAWLRQAGNVAGPGFVVWRPDGSGPANIGQWPVMVTLNDFTELLLAAGYGTRPANPED